LRYSFIRPNFLNSGRNVLDQLCETAALGCRYPREVYPAFVHADVFQKVFKQSEFPTGHQVATNIVAVARVSPGGQHAVSSVTQRADYEQRVNPTGTRYAHHPDVGRVLDTSDTGQVGAGITAPVAQECYNFGIAFHVSVSLPHLQRFNHGYKLLVRATLDIDCSAAAG